ncbi:NAD+ synthase [Siccirubricoccus deserti]|uniref:Glutamine-dependent NAD(+) synthetase n=1 Tax=Siccirubricoccus deserti TaxID=2013562 RepID=A0A9X0R378_9PROT|nr:NAD+ synthase [Siccirubricoccus deserti]MBC4017522.1 NAD+ synthase [Siccirubricoccus deserti]GGC59706.1 NAD+ synthase [Siccirubricoccus deserti]
MSDTIRIALAQLNPHLGDLRGNAERIRVARAEAARLGADLLVTAEFSIAGYPPEDLVLRPAFNAAAAAAIETLAAETADGGPGLVLGGPWVEGGRRYNALFVADGGRIIARRAKHELPNCGVFDDRRLFDAGPAPGPVAFRGFRLGLMIGEDGWFPAVSETLAETGAEVLISINASPFEIGRPERRVDLAVPRVVETGLGLVFLGQLGGQDELVFDGASFVLNPDRSLAVQMPLFEPAVILTEWHRAEGRLVCAPQALAKLPSREEQIWQAMMLGLRDHVEKNRFPGVVLGLSGGIESAVSAAVAADALGPERVRAVMMPSPGTNRTSLEDAAACAAQLGIRYETIDIGPAMAAFQAMLAPAFADRPADATGENIQSRVRGLTLMALSNTSGEMVLTTGNKSEISLGYATLHGDMCGGYSVLKDLYKTQVVALGRWRNAHVPAGARGPRGPVVPERVITRPPSAGSRPGQDSLPPHVVLDAILEGLVEHERDIDALVAEGHDRATVLRVWRMLDRAEYKRRQAPPGVKIGPRAFGRDRRYPITNGYTNLIA